MARPAVARFLGECEERRVAVEAVSAASSAERRESWEVAKAEGSSEVGRVMVAEGVIYVAMSLGGLPGTVGSRGSKDEVQSVCTWAKPCVYY